MVTIRQRKYGNGHRYYVEGDEQVDPTLPLVSCSTIARYADSGGGDGLLYWAADHALATGRRDGFKDASSKAIAVGNDLHAEISEHISTGEQPTNPSALFGAWYSSMQERGIEWLATELMVYNPERLYAGQCDAIGLVDDEVTLFDWKTTDGLDKRGKRKTLGQTTHAAQVGGYWLAMSRLHDALDDHYCNVGFPESYEAMPVPTRLVICYALKDVIEVEWRYVDLSRAVTAFEAAHGIYQATRESLYE
jgi:hypothetical protein